MIMNAQKIFIPIIERQFISPNSCPPFLQIVFTALELFVYTMLISSQMITTAIDMTPSYSRSVQILLALIFLILFRFITRINAIKIFYVIFIYCLSQSSSEGISIISFIFIGASLIADWLSKIQYSFSTSNPHSQKNSSFIAFHYVGCIICTIIKLCNLNLKIVFPIISIVIFSLLLLFKYKSLAKNENFKQLYMRFYILSIFYSLVNLVQVFVSFDSVYKHLISIILSQGLFQIVKYKTKTNFSIEEYISKGLFEEVSFKILSYLYSNQYDGQMQKVIIAYIHDDGSSLLESQRNQSKDSFFKKSYSLLKQDRKQLASKIFQILKQQTSVYSKLLRAEIALYELNDYFNCKIIINKYKQRVSFFSFNQKVLFYKLQYSFNEKIQIQNKSRKCSNLEDFIQNDKFRSLLLKSTLDCIILWQYTKVSQIIYAKLNKIVNKVVHAQEIVHETYYKLKTRQINASLLYVQFLHQVMRDIKKANELMEEVYFYQQNEVDLSFQDKAYISFDLQGDQPLTVSNVGSNISKLLGYQRRLLIGSKHTVFLPNFYNQTHSSLVMKELKQQFDKMFLYYKKTVVKSMNNNYQQMLICLKISFDLEGRLIMHGFLKLMSNTKYNWNNYLFINEKNLQIVQCCDSIRQKIGSGKSKKYNAEDYFDDVQSRNLKKTQIVSQQAIKYYYQPIKSFTNSQDSKIIMFIRIDPFYQSQSQQEQSSAFLVDQVKKNSSLIPKLIFVKKYKMNGEYLSTLKSKVALHQSNSSTTTKLCVFSIIICMLILSLFICEIVINAKVNQELQSKHELINVINKLVTHYMSLSKLALDLSYMQLQFNFNYTWPGYQYSFEETVMNLQQTNQYFKQYSIKQWPYESLSQIQQYHNCYEFVAEITACASVITNIDDLVIQKNMVAAFNQLFTQIFVWSYSEYADGVMKQLNNSQASKKGIRVMLLSFLLVLCIALFIFVVIIQTMIRKSQFESLQFIGGISFQNQMIQNSKRFIQRISRQKIQFMQQNNQDKQKDGIYDNLLKTGDMSSRQNTGRNLMDALSTMRQNNNDLQQKTSEQVFQKSVNIKLKDRNKFILFSFLILLLTILVINLVNIIINQYVKVIDDVQSATNVLRLMNKPLYFTRVVNAFMTQDKIGVKDHDGTFYKSVKAFQSDSNNIATFQQTQFSQFSKFSTLLTQIRYEYLCNYVKCPAEYYDYINILYSTTMQKQVNLMISDYTVQFFHTTGMQIILASETLFRTVMNDLLDIYFVQLQNYAQGIADNQFLAISIVMGLLSLMCFLTGVIGYIYVWKENQKFKKICNLIKQQSYQYNQQDLKIQDEDQKQKIRHVTKTKANANANIDVNAVTEDAFRNTISKNSKISNSFADSGKINKLIK